MAIVYEIKSLCILFPKQHNLIAALVDPLHDGSARFNSWHKKWPAPSAFKVSKVSKV